MPLSAWDKTRIYGTWYTHNGTRIPGTYTVTMPARVTVEAGEAIVPAGVYKTGDLYTEDETRPALDVLVPANDDPDVTPLGWQISIVVRLSLPDGGSVREQYVVDTPVDGEVNLRTIPLAQTIPPTQTMLLRGVPGGVAPLDSEGLVPVEHLPEGFGEAGPEGPQGPQGPAGQDGADGLSAYELAVLDGYEGTLADWLASLEGPQGPEGPPGADGQDGAPGADGQDGADGADGASAYEVALANGFVGTEAEWLASLVGPKGDKGDPGAPGADGQAGADGAGVPVGGATGQVLAKATAADHDTQWIDPPTGGGAVSSVNGKTGDVVLTSDDIEADNNGTPTSVQALLDTKADMSDLAMFPAVVTAPATTRPNVTGPVMWVGHTTTPAEAVEGDIWLEPNV